MQRRTGEVSIPSRRVGDNLKTWLGKKSILGFHPLKAGRRLSDTRAVAIIVSRFHPLKAGRRPVLEPYEPELLPLFPSPQGGSETYGANDDGDDGLLFPSPQGGSETTSLI